MENDKKKVTEKKKVKPKKVLEESKKVVNDKSINKRLKEKNGKLPKWAILVIIGLSLFMFIPNVFIFSFAFYEEFSHDEMIENKLGKYLEFDKPVIGLYDFDSSSYVITGYITNTGDKVIEDLNIGYTLYDGNNNVVGTSYASLEKLKKGKTWKFTVEYKGVNAKDITHFEMNSFYGDYEVWFE